MDFSGAIRVLWRHPGFSLIVIATLALGIGTSAAVFSIVHSLLLKPLPYPNPGRIVTIWNQNRRAGIPRDTSSLANLADLRAESGAFQSVAPYSEYTWTYNEGDTALTAPVAFVGSEFLDTMGVRPLRGRALSEADDKLGSEWVVLLGYPFWRNVFQGDEAVIGRSIRLNQRSFRVIGVMPEGFEYPRGTVAWLNLPSGYRTREVYQNRNYTMFEAAGRLKDGISLPEARLRAAATGESLSRRFPKENAGTTVALLPLLDHLNGPDLPAMLWMLLATVVSVLLIACVNLASLQLARTTARRAEFAIRRALGAGTGRVAGLLLTESLTLAVAGAALGAALAAIGVRAFSLANPMQLPRSADIEMGWPVLLFAIVLAVGAGLFFGLAPALDAAGVPLASVLREDAESVHGRRPYLREFMLAAQLALTLLLCGGAVLMTRSFAGLQSAELGLNKENVLTFRLSLPSAVYGDLEKVGGFYRDLARELEALPGAVQAGIGGGLLRAGMPTTMLRMEGRPEETVEVGFDSVSPRFFSTLGIPLREGRFFRAEDQLGKPGAAIVNESFAKRYWPGERAVGKRLQMVDEIGTEEIVGVVGDSRTVSPGQAAAPMFYSPILQKPMLPAQVVLRIDPRKGSSKNLGEGVRRAVRSLDRNVAIEQMEMLDESYDRRLAPSRASAKLLGLFTAFAVLLAAIGVYGLLSYQVRLRRREIGIRMALGSTPGAIVWKLCRRALAAVAGGLALGTAGAAWLSRQMAGVLPHEAGGVAGDILAVGALVLVVIVVAGAAPVLRAAEMPPLEALRM